MSGMDNETYEQLRRRPRLTAHEQHTLRLRDVLRLRQRSGK